MEHRITFDFYFACFLTVLLHGFSALKVFLILYGNYKIAKTLPKAYIPLATWISNIGILFANELCRGYPYASIAIALFPQTVKGPTGVELQAPAWATWLDSHGGINPRWEVLFNLTVLRLISFNIDYCWSFSQQGGSPLEVCGPSNINQVS